MGLEAIRQWLQEQADQVEPQARQLQDRAIQPIQQEARDKERPHASPHEDQERIGLPPGRTRFDLVKGTAEHGATEALILDGFRTVGELAQVGTQRAAESDANVARALLVMADTGGATLEAGGSVVPMIPGVFYPIERSPIGSFLVDCDRPTELYIVLTGRSRPFARPSTGPLYQERIGPSTTQTPDAFVDLGFQTIDSSDDSDLTDAEAQDAELDVRPLQFLTWIVENTGANAAEVQVVANAVGRGKGRFSVTKPANQPVTVASGDTAIINLNGEAYHLAKLQARNAVSGEEITLEYEFGGGA